MIYKIVCLFAYMILFPIGLGLLAQSTLWKASFKKRGFCVRLLDSYVSGVLGVFFLFEFLSKLILNDTSEYIAFLSYASKFFMVILGLVIVLVLVMFSTCWKNSVHELLHKETHFRLCGREVVLVISVLIYIIIAVLFVAPNPLDDTIVNIIAMFKWNGIAVFEPYKWTPLSDMDGHTKMIEMLYATYADMIGVNFISFIEYIVSACYLIFFFAVYKRIERIILYYFSSLQKNQKWMERIFFVICIALLFINGSLEMAIPQNIWNGTTLLASTVMPLAFTYGFGALMEFERKHGLGSLCWILRMILLLPAAAVLHDHGYQLVTVMVLIVLAVMGSKCLKQFCSMSRC